MEKCTMVIIPSALHMIAFMQAIQLLVCSHQNCNIYASADH